MTQERNTKSRFMVKTNSVFVIAAQENRVFGKELDANLIYIDATDRFLDLLAGVSEPEKKRKIIGGEFIKVFDEEASKLEGISFLAQGTIYPDILESDADRP